jgi:hypothetical protein
MFSIGKPFLIAGIILAVYLALVYYLPVEIPGFSVVAEEEILTSMVGLVDVSMGLSADFIDWPFIKIIVEILQDLAIVYITLMIFFYITHWASQSQ